MTVSVTFRNMYPTKIIGVESRGVEGIIWVTVLPMGHC